MPQPAAAPHPHTWAVTGHAEEPSIDENGKPTTIHTVSFKTNTGHESSVSLPDSHFSAANVAEQIKYKAGEIVNTAGMNSSNAPAPE